VRVVAGDREVVDPTAAGAPNHDDLATALERHPGCKSAAREVGCLPAVSGEVRVERPVGVVAGDRELRAGFGAHYASNDDLAVAPDRHRPRVVAATREVGRLLSVAGEALVERAVGVVAGEPEVRPVRGEHAADRDELAVRLASDRFRAAVTQAEVRPLHAVAGEGRVEVAGGRLRSRREDKAD
jgi:hypothetical protein